MKNGKIKTITMSSSETSPVSLKEAQTFSISSGEKTKEFKQILDLDEVLVVLEDDEKLKKSIEIFEEFTFDDDGSVNQLIINTPSLQSSAVNTLIIFHKTIDSLEAKIAAGASRKKFPSSVLEKDIGLAIGAINVIRGLITTYATKLESVTDLSVEQQLELKLAEEGDVEKSSDPDDLVSFGKEIIDLNKQFSATDVFTESNYLDPRKEITISDGRKITPIEFLNERIDYFRIIYSLDGVVVPAQRVQLLQLIENYIRPAEKLALKLVERQGKIQTKEFSDWKANSNEYKNFIQKITSYENKTSGLVTDGSVDLSSEISELNKFLKEMDEDIVKSPYSGREDLFDEESKRFIKIISELQLAQYLFLIKPLRKVIKDVQSKNKADIKNLGKVKRSRLIAKLDDLRITSGKDSLQHQFFAEEISDKFGFIEDSQNSGFSLVAEYKEEFIKAKSSLEIEETTSITLENYRKKTLLELITNWHTGDIQPDADPRDALEIAFREKLEEVDEDFYSQSEISGESKVESEERLTNFRELYEQLYGLVDFGILHSKNLNVLQGVAIHEGILKSANIEGAMNLNAEFNKNPLVGSENLDQSDMFGSKMGIIQMIVFASFQRQKSKKLPFTRNQGYEANMMVELIDTVCESEDVEMWNGETSSSYSGLNKQINIKEELAKFPKDLIPLIKRLAQWKYSRDDLGSKASIFHWGENKGAFKKAEDGASDKQAHGILAAQCYQVGKNTKFQGHMTSLAFMTSENSSFMNNNHVNDIDIMRGIEKVDRYLLYEHPQLRGTWYDENVPESGSIGVKHKYRPNEWWQDFPGLDHFFNKTEQVFTGADYKQSREAVFRMIEMATESVLVSVPHSLEEIEMFIISIVQNFNTQIGMSLSYSGKFNDHSEGYDIDGPFGDINELNYVNELILAAFKFYIMNVLVNIPQDTGSMPLSEVVLRKLSTSGEITELVDPDYYDRFHKAVEVFKDVINKNGTLATYFQKELTGKIGVESDKTTEIKRTDGVIPFVDLPFQNVFRDQHKLSNIYTERISQMEKEAAKEKGHKKKKKGILAAYRAASAEASFKDEVVSSPWRIVAGDVWKSQPKHVH